MKIISQVIDCFSLKICHRTHFVGRIHNIWLLVARFLFNCSNQISSEWHRTDFINCNICSKQWKTKRLFILNKICLFTFRNWNDRREKILIEQFRKRQIFFFMSRIQTENQIHKQKILSFQNVSFNK